MEKIRVKKIEVEKLLVELQGKHEQFFSDTKHKKTCKETHKKEYTTRNLWKNEENITKFMCVCVMEKNEWTRKNNAENQQRAK